MMAIPGGPLDFETTVCAAQNLLFKIVPLQCSSICLKRYPFSAFSLDLPNPYSALYLSAVNLRERKSLGNFLFQRKTGKNILVSCNYQTIEAFSNKREV